MSLPRQLNKEIRRQLDGFDGSAFLNIGVTLAVFHEDGKEDSVSSLIKIERSLASSFAPALISRGLTRSGPQDFYGSMLEIAPLTYWGDISM